MMADSTSRLQRTRLRHRGRALARKARHGDYQAAIEVNKLVIGGRIQADDLRLTLTEVYDLPLLARRAA